MAILLFVNWVLVLTAASWVPGGKLKQGGSKEQERIWPSELEASVAPNGSCCQADLIFHLCLLSPLCPATSAVHCSLTAWAVSSRATLLLSLLPSFPHSVPPPGSPWPWPSQAVFSVFPACSSTQLHHCMSHGVEPLLVLVSVSSTVSELLGVRDCLAHLCTAVSGRVPAPLQTGRCLVGGWMDEDFARHNNEFYCIG